MSARRVTDSNRPPYNAIGFLLMAWSTGKWMGGSASLLDHQYLLTCSHNLLTAVSDPTGEGNATAMYFYPGFNQSITQLPMPNGLPVATGYYANPFADGDDEWDVAVCRLAAPLAAPLDYYFTPVITGEEIVEKYVSLTGYPGVHRGEMWDDNDQVAGVHERSNTIVYTHDTWKGDSGSPVWSYIAEKEAVYQYAIHVSRQEQELRRGLLITRAVYSWIQGALAATPPPGSGLQLVGR